MRAMTVKAMSHRGCLIAKGVVLDTAAPETSLFAARVEELRRYLSEEKVTVDNIPNAPDKAKVFKDWPKKTRRIS
jgi:hypothetical protein